MINPRAGEAEPLTSLDDGVDSFAWSPDGTQIAYTATEPKLAAVEEREKKYGEFQIVEQDYRMTHLFVLEVATQATRPLTSGAFTVGRFHWSSPDGTMIAFDHRINRSPGSTTRSRPGSSSIRASKGSATTHRSRKAIARRWSTTFDLYLFQSRAKSTSQER